MDMARAARWKNVNLSAKAFIGFVILTGISVLLYGGAHLRSHNIAEFVCYLLIALLASQLRVTLPAMADTLSVNFLFVLVGILDLSFTETLMLGCAGVIVQYFYVAGNRPIRIAFNICCSAVSTAMAYATYHQVFVARQASCHRALDVRSIGFRLFSGKYGYPRRHDLALRKRGLSSGSGWITTAGRSPITLGVRRWLAFWAG